MLTVDIRHRFAGFGLDAQFEAPQGLTALFGRSGSGKTTIVNAVAGLMRPQEGRIQSGDLVLSDSRTGAFLPPHRRGIGYVFQDARLFPHLTVQQNLFYGRWFSGRKAADPGRIIEMLGIGHLLDRRPAGLSGGEKQRVALGRAILSNPRLLLMDEPLAALDDQRKAEILPYLERLRDETGLPILYVSHSAAEIARLATTIVLIRQGRVFASGPAATILSNPDTAQVLGVDEAGGLLNARVVAREADGLMRLTTPAGPVWLTDPGDLAEGADLRLRILARDVMLSRVRPEQISALNVLPVTLIDVIADGETGMLAQLDAGGETILSRITRRSASTLDLSPGQELFAVLKAVSVAAASVGRGSAARSGS